MLKGHPIAAYLKFSLFAALVYAVVVVFFIKDASYVDTWLLYVGNILFAAVIALFIFVWAPKTDTTSKLAVAAYITGIMGVTLAIIFIGILLLVFIPSVASHTPSVNAVLADAPGSLQARSQGSHGFVPIILIDALLGNLAGGFFVAVLFPFALEKNKKTD